MNAIRKERYTVPIGACGGFEVMAIALARKLAALPPSDRRVGVFVTLDEADWGYTQCLIREDRRAVRAECVSNEYLPTELHISERGEDRLVDLGFTRPFQDRSPNFSADFDGPVDWDRVAHLLLAPWALVLGCAPGDHITVEVESL